MILETYVCPQCGSTERLWVKSGGDENGAMMVLGYRGSESKVVYTHWIDACASCGAVYCFKYTKDPIPAEEYKVTKTG